MRVARIREAGGKQSLAGVALQVQRFLTGAGVPGIVRVKGSNRLQLPGGIIAYVSGARVLTGRKTIAQVLDLVGQNTDAPVVVRAVDEQIERAQVTLRLEDFAALVVLAGAQLRGGGRGQ